MKKISKKLSFGVSIIPIIVLIVLLTLNIKFADGEAHMPILATAIVAAVIARTAGFSWEELEKGIIDTLKESLQSMLIFCIIGIVIGMWILGGIVPTMIYYGLKLISPNLFLVTACIICSIVALATGSSWTTVGTVGIALMGIGHGLGVPAPMVAGAIISGSYFGDKISPLSDTTNLAPTVSGTTLFEHVRHMIYTTTPSYIITLIAYAILGAKYSGASYSSGLLETILNGLRGQFTISPILFIPPLFIIVMVIKKIPAIPGLIISALLGALCAVIFQNADMASIVRTAQYGYVSNSGVQVIDELLSGGGLDSMMWPLSLVFISMSLAGIMERSGMMDAVANKILTYAKSVGGLITATVLTCISVNTITGDQYLSIVFTGKMYKKEYDKRDLDPKNLSRTLEDAGTLTSPLIPWNACAVFMASTLNVATIKYLPYALLGLINPIVAIIFGYTGFTIVKKQKASTTNVG